MTKPYIAGICQTPVTKNLTMSYKDLAFAMVSGALADAGIPKSEVDGFLVSPPGLASPPALLYACELVDYMQFSTKNLAMFECGGASSAVAFRFACDVVRQGRCRVCVVFAMDYRSIDVPEGDVKIFFHHAVRLQTSLYGPYNGAYGIGTPIPFYAMSAQRYMYEYRATEEDLARITVQLRSHAVKNENALFRKPLTIQDVLASSYVSPPLRQLHCCYTASGGAAVVVVSEDVAKQAKQPAVAVRGIGEYHHPSHFIPLREPISIYPAVVKAGQEAYREANIKPEDVDVAEVLGVFAGTELMVYEDLGFFKKGEAPKAVAEGKTTYGGNVVMNPGGGRLSQGYPSGAAPVMMVCEITTHLRGQAGERQVKDAAMGLVQSEHGMMNGSLVFILERL